MKYKIICSSPLLQSTLEYFLKEYLSNDGIIITDNKDIEGVLIGRDIKKPFTKTSLILQLEKISFVKEYTIENTSFNKNETFKDKLTLEERLEDLIDQFKQNLISLIKEEYAKE